MRMAVPDFQTENDQKRPADDLNQIELAFDEPRDGGDAKYRGGRVERVCDNSPKPNEHPMAKPTAHGMLDGHDVDGSDRRRGDDTDEEADNGIFQKRSQASLRCVVVARAGGNTFDSAAAHAPQAYQRRFLLFSHCHELIKEERLAAKRF
jgi:hypothetical protein